ncbi:MAG: FxsA family protein [Shimia sp.]
MWLFLAFLVVPLIEIGLFIQVGGWIGLWPTLAIVVLTAVIGTLLVRQQGARAMRDLRGSFERLGDPTEPLAHGAMILVSAALLLTPGFFTDAVGFALLLPPVRTVILRHLRARVRLQRFEMGPRRPAPRDDVVEGEAVDITGEAPPRPGPSGWTER